MSESELPIVERTAGAAETRPPEPRETIMDREDRL